MDINYYFNLIRQTDWVRNLCYQKPVQKHRFQLLKGKPFVTPCLKMWDLSDTFSLIVLLCMSKLYKEIYIWLCSEIKLGWHIISIIHTPEFVSVVLVKLIEWEIGIKHFVNAD